MSCSCGEERETCRRRVVEGVQTSGARQTSTDGRLIEQRLEARSDVGQMMLEKVDALRPPLIVWGRLSPESPRVNRQAFTVSHFHILPRAPLVLCLN